MSPAARGAARRGVRRRAAAGVRPHRHEHRVGPRVTSDRLVLESVQALLGRELTADAAVQVALLNNRNLQATYEDLGVAQADLVAGGAAAESRLRRRLQVPRGRRRDDARAGGRAGFPRRAFHPAPPARGRGRVRGGEAAGDGRGAGPGRRTPPRVLRPLQAAEQTLETATDRCRATEASYDLARRLRDAGNITDLDLVNEQAQFEQSKLDLARGRSGRCAGRASGSTC